MASIRSASIGKVILLLSVVTFSPHRHYFVLILHDYQGLSYLNLKFGHCYVSSALVNTWSRNSSVGTSITVRSLLGIHCYAGYGWRETATKIRAVHNGSKLVTVTGEAKNQTGADDSDKGSFNLTIWEVVQVTAALLKQASIPIFL